MNKKDNIRYFKNELKSYKFLKKQRLELLDDIKVLNHQFSSVSGPNYGGIRIENNYHEVNPLTIIEDQLKQKRKVLNSVEYRINYIDIFLDGLDKDLKTDIMSIYVYNSCTIEQRAAYNGLTYKQERNNIDVVINDYIVGGIKKG